ncbi:MAG: hypothetical protein ABEN55_21050 [Bradymonadaceae bacterium]
MISIPLKIRGRTRFIPDIDVNADVIDAVLDVFHQGKFQLPDGEWVLIVDEHTHDIEAIRTAEFDRSILMIKRSS